MTQLFLDGHTFQEYVDIEQKHWHVFNGLEKLGVLRI